jgi:hypothetical protein
MKGMLLLMQLSRLGQLLLLLLLLLLCCASAAGWPCELAAANDVQVQVVHRLTCSSSSSRGRKSCWLQGTLLTAAVAQTEFNVVYVGLSMLATTIKKPSKHAVLPCTILSPHRANDVTPLSAELETTLSCPDATDNAVQHPANCLLSLQPRALQLCSCNKSTDGPIAVLDHITTRCCSCTHIPLVHHSPPP